MTAEMDRLLADIDHLIAESRKPEPDESYRQALANIDLGEPTCAHPPSPAYLVELARVRVWLDVLAFCAAGLAVLVSGSFPVAAVLAGMLALIVLRSAAEAAHHHRLLNR